jgi:archaeosine-15-forming tRNA-guanine transglycosylase
MIIERQENDIYLRLISQFDHFQSIQDIDIAIISFKNKIRFVLISREQYMTQRARDAYVTLIC